MNTQPRTVYSHKSGKGYRFTFRKGKHTQAAGEFRFLSHPDSCPDGEWHYFSFTYAWPQPKYEWVLMNSPRH